MRISQKISLVVGMTLGMTACDSCNRQKDVPTAEEEQNHKSDEPEMNQGEGEVVVAKDPNNLTSREDVAAAIEKVKSSNVLETIVEKEGVGAVAASGQRVHVHYTGYLTNGQKFDSSRDRQQPFDFTLGQGQVISGWDQGVAGMKIGERRVLIIPSEMGYGARGAGSVIPPDSILVFDVELLEVK